MKIIEKGRRFLVVESSSILKKQKVLSIHPTRGNAEYWIKKRS